MTGPMHLFRSRIARGFAVLLSLSLPFAGAPRAAFAQSEAAPPVDPPALVGQLTGVSGTVSFHTADQTSWQPADPNYPITSGNSLWTQPGAAAAVVFGASRIAMDQATELDITTLDQQRLVATVPQGAVFLRLRGLRPGDAAIIATPRGDVSIGEDGIYEIAAGDQADPTRVMVWQGAAQVSGSGVSSVVQPGQMATITGNGPFALALGPAQQDPFFSAQLAATVPPPPPSYGAAPPPVVAQMSGGQELAGVGTWQQSPQYGAIWYPPVAPGWVPYREGHWVWIAPWGWTWVDDAPWGFAPFHYGRWVDDGGRWGWIPVLPGVVVAAPPVYAPALVAFFGISVGIGISFGHPVGWCPLGPDEPFHPWYHASPAYIRNVNVVNVRNINRINVTNVYNTTTINHFVNRQAVTVVPSQVMAASRPVARNRQHVAPTQFAAARPLTTAPVRPTAATVGLTPNVARHFGVEPPPPQRLAPGPVVRPRPVGAPVALRPPGGAPVVQPLITGPHGQPAVQPGAHPGVPQAAPHPGVPQAVQPSGVPHPQSTPPGAAHPAAPGPAFRPQAPGRPTELPALRPAPAPAARPQPATPTPQPQRVGPQPQHQQPQVQHQQPSLAPLGAPHPVAPGPAIRPQAPGTPEQRPALRLAPGPATPPQHVTPAPQQHTAPPPQPHVAPAPQQHYAPPPQPHYAPAPQQHYAPPPQPHYAPAPQQHYAPPPQPHYAPPPQPHYAPAPQQHYAPPPQPHYAPPPQPHYAPAPRPEPARPQPRACPPGHPQC
ncbi:MAG: hypothetical protein KGK10_05185 [Rhodospirillales bacterium]|nr:hypothetical protein [Rhodospirillales bacterium]